MVTLNVALMDSEMRMGLREKGWVVWEIDEGLKEED
jgi:hypothetical protein